MNKQAKAKIHWLSNEEGGRKRPPMGPRGTEYKAPSHFEYDTEYWPDNFWILVVRFDESAYGKLDIDATVWFLFPKAPHHFLQPGHQFELFEGLCIVARGEIISIVPQAEKIRVS